MRAVIQRVSQASVTVDGQIVGQIATGLVALLGVENGDETEDCNYIANKIAALRIFPDVDDKMNLSLIDIDASVLAVSQFTLLGDARKGRRPSFITAADPESGKQLYLQCVDEMNRLGAKVETGIFQANMQVSLINDGPVTILLDSRKRF